MGPLAFTCSFAISRLAHAQAVDETGSARVAAEERLRNFKLLRDQENWAWLRRDHLTSDLWDGLKYLEISHEEAIFVSIGGETRQWVESYRNELWGKSPSASNTYWLQRYMLHADAHLTPYARIFVQAKSGLEFGRVGGPRPVDKDVFDLNQAFSDAVVLPGASLDTDPRAVIRIGRQEMSYGSGRFIDVREGPNVRFGYDGARLLTRFDPIRFDAFLVRPSLTKPGALDDAADVHQVFGGIWATLDRPALLADAYFLSLERDSFAYQRVQGRELRRTVGARLRARRELFELELESAYQFGAVGPLSIAAWTVAGEAVLRGPPLVLAPVLTLGVGATSGDHGSASSHLGTFNALFPRGAYFGLVSANGPSNEISPHVALALSLPFGFAVSGELWAFWRESMADGVYSVPGTLLRGGTPKQRRFLGTQAEGYLSWRYDRHFSMNTTLAYFNTGSFFETSLPGRNITYGAAWASYKF